jgi:radical SAM protein with 4Fe4S-binding SPASM domain
VTHDVDSHEQGRGREPKQLGKARRARAFSKAIPLTIHVELTKRCNLRCIHCYVAGRRDELPAERLAALFDELAAEGTLGVALTGGELALREDWLDIARAARRSGMLLHMQTNGTLFDADDIEAIADLKPASVAVSLYGGAAAAHDAVTGVEGSFERAVATIRGLTAAGVRVGIGSVLMRETLDEFPQIIELARGIGCTVMFDPTVAPRSDGTSDVVEHRVCIEQLKHFYLDERIFADTREGRLAMRPDDLPARTAANCTAGFTTAFIEADGEVFPCMGFLPSFGNVSEASFREVWQGEVAREHRRAMMRPLEQCNACEMVAYCVNRCARLAAVEDGDVSGPSTRACELAVLVRDLREIYRCRAACPAVRE